MGGVCLLLWGLILLRLGMTRGFGASLQNWLATSTKNRVTAFMSGLAVTTLLQSSMATVLIIAGFAAQGMISVSAGLAAILGADVGTTLVAQLLSLNMTWLMPSMMVIGFVLFSFKNNGKLKNIGRICIGLALMLMALSWIKGAAVPLQHSDTLPLILKPLQGDLVMTMLIAALMTWLAHSSLAIILMLMSLAASGVLPLEMAMHMVLGANVGGTIAPFVSTMRDKPQAMRIPFGNMIIRMAGIVLILPFVHMVQPLLERLDPDPARQIVNFHTAFNLALALLFLPLTGLVMKLAQRIIPDKADAEDPALPRYLDHNAIDTPSIALSGAGREALRMADMIQKMLEDTIRVYRTDDEKLALKIQDDEQVVDKLYSSLKTYMARLSQEFMDPKEAQRYLQILSFSTNLEHAGDVIEKNLIQMAMKKIRNKYSFSAQGFKEIENIHNLVLDSVRLAQTVFVTGDASLARRIVEEKEKIRLAEILASSSHIERLRDGNPQSIATSSLHLDIIRDYRRINTYMCTVAYPILEGTGELRSRLIPRKEPVAAKPETAAAEAPAGESNDDGKQASI